MVTSYVGFEVISRVKGQTTKVARDHSVGLLLVMNILSERGKLLARYRITFIIYSLVRFVAQLGRSTQCGVVRYKDRDMVRVVRWIVIDFITFIKRIVQCRKEDIISGIMRRFLVIT